MGWARRGRFELKYALPADRCAEIVSDAAEWIRPDPHGEPLPGGGQGYRVHSLYFDTCRDGQYTLEDYRARLAERRVRDRLRVRTYGQPGQNAAVFLENKRKHDSRVVKGRAKLCDEGAWHAAPGPHPWRALSQHLSGTARAFCDSFHRLIAQGQRAPVSVVHYERESYLDRRPEHRGVRLTIDRRVCATLRPQTLSLYAAPDAWLLPPDWCVLEMKFSETRPAWMRALCRRHRLQAHPVSKFGLSVVLGFHAEDASQRRFFTPQPLRALGRLAAAEAVA